MTNYVRIPVILTKKAQKDLRNIPNQPYRRIRSRLEDLSCGKANLDIKQLTNQSGYPLRVGRYRILFLV